MRFQLVNDTGRSEPVYWMIWGTDPETGKVSWLDPHGKTHPLRPDTSCSIYQFLLGSVVEIEILNVPDATLAISFGSRCYTSIRMGEDNRPLVREATNNLLCTPIPSGVPFAMVSLGAH